jgi:hypothetical protein
MTKICKNFDKLSLFSPLKMTREKHRITIELRKSNGTLSILLHPPHPPLSPDYGGEDKGWGSNVMAIFVPLFTLKSIIQILQQEFF